MSQEWYDGLCREFTKSVYRILKSYEVSSTEYNSASVGRDVIHLFHEMFDEKIEG